MPFSTDTVGKKPTYVVASFHGCNVTIDTALNKVIDERSDGLRNEHASVDLRELPRVITKSDTTTGPQRQADPRELRSSQDT